MNPEADRLYNLLPALYRIRDAQEGEPLKALCAIIAEDIAVLRENLDQLYDDQFIETCADWVAPYIGDLIGYRTLHAVTARTSSARAEVANTIAYRRRKGTATVLEQLARDVTGWHARAVEFFQWLETSQYMNHIRPANLATANIRDWEALERRGTAFNSLAHSVDMRRIETQQGRYNIPNIGLFLWRLDAFSLRGSPAFRVDDERFLFSPLGNDTQLFSRPRSETDITHLAEPINVPEPISRRRLDRYPDRYYGPGLSLFVETDNLDTTFGNVHVCNLSDQGATWAHLPVSHVSIDPVLGRIAFPPGTPPVNPRVTYHYGFSMATGGGEYERGRTFGIGGGLTGVIQGQSLQAALTATQGGGIVEIGDSGRYAETLTANVSAGAKVELRAANEQRPTIALGGDWNIALAPGAELTLNGLLITGGPLHITAAGGSGTRIIRLRHCTLAPGLALSRAGEPVSPGAPSLIVEEVSTSVEIEHCLVGALATLESTVVTIANSLVDATAPTLVAFAGSDGLIAGGALTIVNSTVIGKVHTIRLDLATNTIFAAGLAVGDAWTHPVLSDQNQQGCVRFSFLPLNAIVPRRYRCQPDLAVEAALLEADRPKGSLSAAKRLSITMATQARVRPAFTARRYGQPAYGQLAGHCPEEISRGADDESEMGLFHDVFAPQRENNLTIRLQEYLRFGLEAGLFHAT
ncbi:MAG: uncharacterized protein K0S45_1496 [Nitrospira sp.]|jgi:hypothetical protein|nr:uncharacterized protein [Nitrospira sp.]